MYGSNFGLWSVLLDEPSSRSNESGALRKVKGENKDTLMTLRQIGVARLDAARVVETERGLTQEHTREGRRREEKSTRL